MLVTADPGARAHFIAEWLQGNLKQSHYDVGLNCFSDFVKLHTDWDNQAVKQHSGVKIRIRPGYTKLALHLYLFLTKNVYPQLKNFSRNGFDLETYTKVVEAAKYWFKHDCQVDNSLYDYVIDFEDTFDHDFLIDLYYKVNQTLPNPEQIDILKQTNQINQPEFDINHACSIAAMIIQREYELGFREDIRFWSLPAIYNSTEPTELYNTIWHKIHRSNYGTNLEDNYDIQ